MTTMRCYLSAIVFFFCLNMLSAQPRTSHRWQVGLGGGLMGYWGDLNEDFITPSQGWLDKDRELLTYSAYLERLGKNGFGWRIYASKGAFEANDRRVDWQGVIDTDYALFGRGLNVRTKIQEAGLQFVFRTDNDWLLGSRAAIAPYFAIGGGFTYFRPYGDRFYGSNQRYHYWADGSIRDLPENPLTQPIAQIVEPDNNFETALWSFDTEDENYQRLTWHASASIGLSFRISKRIGIQLEYNARYTGTDQLDDISGNYLKIADSERAYLSNPTGWTESRSTLNKDWYDAYHFATIGVRYRLGEHRNELDLPIIYHNEFAYPATEAIATAPVNTPAPRVVYTYFYSNTGLIAFDPQGNIIPWEPSFDFPEGGAKNIVATTEKTSKPSFSTVPEAVAPTNTDSATSIPIATTPVKIAVADTVAKTIAIDTITSQQVVTVAKTKKTGFSALPTEEEKTVPDNKKGPKTGYSSVAVTPVAVNPANAQVIDSLKRVTLGQQSQIDQLKSQLAYIQSALPINTIVNAGTGVRVVYKDSLAVKDTVAYQQQAQRMNELMRRVEALEYQLMTIRSNGPVSPVNSGSEALVVQQLQQMNQQLQQLVQQTLNSQQQQLQQQQRLQATIQKLESELAGKSVAPASTPVAQTTPPIMAEAFAKTVVFFELGSANLSTWSRDRLQATGLFLNQNPSQKMFIRGYTDQIGSAAANAKLAQERANQVLTFLQQMGVGATQLVLDYTGPDLTLTDKKSSYGRRVEIIKAP